MDFADTLEGSSPASPRAFQSPRPRSALAIRLTTGLLLAGLSACSDDKGDGNPVTAAGTSATGGSASGGTSGGGSPAVGGSSAKGWLGGFKVTLNPAVENAPAYTSILGKVYSGPYPTDVIETVIASDANCTAYKYSRHACFEPSCTGDQVCAAENVCEPTPSPVSVGDVSVTGVGDSSLKLTATNLNYQYPLDPPYPGISEGEPVTLTGTGGVFGAFTISAEGVAPLATSESSYTIADDQPLTLTWTPGSNVDAEVTATLNISKHGGSAGYMLCTTTDSGTLTISAEVLSALVGLGVSGFPELLLTRSTHGEATVSAGTIGLDVEAGAKPALNVEGYCSCFNNSDCGSCSDTTKTSCDSLKRLCKAP